MRKAKLLSIAVLLALLLGPASGMALAQKPPPQPTWWGRVIATRWEDAWSGGRLHKLTVWNLPFCHSQEYLGPGGYADTCSSNHGCIDQWTWWLRTPESKLGVPYLWWLFKPERRNINNYRATCWIQ